MKEKDVKKYRWILFVFVHILSLFFNRIFFLRVLGLNSTNTLRRVYTCVIRQCWKKGGKRRGKGTGEQVVLSNSEERTLSRWRERLEWVLMATWLRPVPYGAFFCLGLYYTPASRGFDSYSRPRHQDLPIVKSKELVKLKNVHFLFAPFLVSGSWSSGFRIILCTFFTLETLFTEFFLIIALTYFSFRITSLVYKRKHVFSTTDILQLFIIRGLIDINFYFTSWVPF